MSKMVVESHLELSRCFQAAEVGTGGDSLLQRLKKHSLEVQHVGQTAEQRLHLGEKRRGQRRQKQPDDSWANSALCVYLVFTEEGLRLQRRQVDVEETDQVLRRQVLLQSSSRHTQRCSTHFPKNETNIEYLYQHVWFFYNKTAGRV